MTPIRPGKSLPPIVYCSDPDVQHFVESDLCDFNPYRACDEIRGAHELKDAACQRFGFAKCWDIRIVRH
jgi:hypothetical protein